MTAEFDSSGFSALDKFFGKGTEEASSGEKRTTGSSTAGSRGKQRGGVGARSKSIDAAKPISSDVLAKQIMGVGRKRARENSNQDVGEDFDALDDHGVHDTDEADGGRTSIAATKTSREKKMGGKDKNPMPKKKLGKKERERQKNAANNIEVVGADASQEGLPSIDNTATTETSTNENSNEVIAKQNESTEPKPKRKRRKVRSRQKNIRKDNRSADEKPAHLIPGNVNYKGRPMTQATREKLNLPPPDKKTKHRKNFNNNNNNNNGEGENSSLFVIDRNPDDPGDDMGVNLAIDDFMKDTDGSDAKNSAPLNESTGHEPGVKKRKKSSKRKRRFKNLN